MAHVVDTVKYLNAVCLMLRDGQKDVPVPITGVSMRPFLRDGDTVFLSAITEPVRRGDIVLFLRRNGQYVLHRVLKVNPDGSFLMLGDSQLVPEPVMADQLRGKVSFARCGGQVVKPGSLRWWFYAVPWLALAPVRRQISQVRNLFRR